VLDFSSSAPGRRFLRLMKGNLRKEVRTCEFRDVDIMLEMLAMDGGTATEKVSGENLV
jgi:hypothetical protein